MGRIFPSFEKPVARERYLNSRSERRGGFRGIAAVLLLAAGCGVALALWEPSHQVTSPFATASVAPPAAAVAKPLETTAAATEADDDATPTVKLSQFCSQRTTARRDCANAKAFKDARINAPEPEIMKPVAVKPDTAAKTEKVAISDPVPPVPAPITAEEQIAPQQPQKQAAPKVRQRAQDPAPVERLVRVYDQIMPDGRRVPVYRRVGASGYETGTIVGGEYRPTRRADLDRPQGRYGLR